MENEEAKKDIKKEIFFLYISFKRHYEQNPKYNTNYSNRVDSMLNNFCKLLEDRYEIESLGSSFFVDYFYFLFHFYRNHKRSSSLSWFVGRVALERWVKRRKDWRYFANKDIGEIPYKIRYSIKTTGVSTSKARTGRSNYFYANFKDEHLIDLNPFEEKEKKRFYRTETCFVFCFNFTTLFNPKSRYCLSCKNRKICKETLKEVFPQIAKIRGV